MSDVSQGTGWWLASDARWYSPEQHPDYRPPPPPPQPKPQQASKVASPSSNGMPVAAVRMSPIRLVNVAAFVGAVVGLLMAWGTAFIANVNGLDTDDGKLFGSILVVAALLAWWRVARTGRLNGCLLVAVWLGLLVFGVAEVIHISSSSVVTVGDGLYVDVAAAAIGTVSASMDTRRHWSRAARAARPAQKPTPSAPLASKVESEPPPPQWPQPPFSEPTPSAPLASKVESETPPLLSERVEAAHAERSAARRPVYKKWQVWLGLAVLAVAIQDVVLVNVTHSKNTAATSENSAATSKNTVATNGFESTTTAGAAAPLPYTESAAGPATTPPFMVTDSSWRLKWSYNCSGQTSSDFGLYVYIDGGPEDGTTPVSDPSEEGSGETSAYYGRGTISLNLSTLCNWSVTVLQP